MKKLLLAVLLLSGCFGHIYVEEGGLSPHCDEYWVPAHFDYKGTGYWEPGHWQCTR